MDSVRLSADEGLSSLARALRHSEPAARARALTVISELMGARAGELLKTMMHDPAAEVRLAAVRTAVRSGASDLVASLIVALSDPDADVRAAAAQAVSRVTQCRVAAGTAEEIDAVKGWWKEKRFAELSSSVRFPSVSVGAGAEP